jgi:hypothetical protein
MHFGKEFLICEDPKGLIMNIASVGTPSQKMSEKNRGFHWFAMPNRSFWINVEKRGVLVIIVAEQSSLIPVG